MPKPEWGVKRTCASCGARFYDLMKDPILCPDCGAAFVMETPKAARRRVVEPAASTEVETEDVDLVDDGEDVLDTEDDDDDDVTVGAAEAADDDEDDALEPDDSVLLEDDSDDDDLSEFGDDPDDDDRR